MVIITESKGFRIGKYNMFDNSQDAMKSRRCFLRGAAGTAMGAALSSRSEAAPKHAVLKQAKSTFEIAFTGTGAADWTGGYPSAGKVMARGSFRGTAGILVDSKLMIDCGKTIPDAVIHHGIDIQAVSDLFLTHSHGDHVNSEALKRITEMTEQRGLRIWGHGPALDRCEIPDVFTKCPVEPMSTVKAAGMSITALPANHVVGNSSETPLHYLLEKDGRRLLYATDGAWLLKPVWLYLRERPLDMIIWDATIGDIPDDWRIFEHNSLAMIQLMGATLKTAGVLTDHSRQYLTHMARTLWPDHESVENLLRDSELTAAWDGLRIMA